jgi:hypothetical protein
MTRITFSTSVLVLWMASTLGAETGAPRPWKKRWLVSSAALVAVNILDVHSSRGLREANPLLSDASGRFATRRAVLLKGAITGGFLAFQCGLMRAHPEKDYYRVFTVANAMASGSLGAVVAHNYALPAAPSRAVPAHLAPALD